MGKYNETIVERICSLIESDTYTIAEICTIVGISRETYFHWKNTKSDFSYKIRGAESEKRERMTVAAKKSLLKRIQGFMVEEKKTVKVDSGKRDAAGNSIPRIKAQVITEKYIPPDIHAIIFALTNLDSENWKVSQSRKVSAKVNQANKFMIEVVDSFIKDLSKKRKSEGLPTAQLAKKEMDRIES